MKYLTLFLILASSAFADFGNPSPGSVIRYTYSGSTVTTSAWTQLSASLPNVVRAVQIFDSSGQTMQLGLGPSGSEIAMPWYIYPGGQNDMIPMVAGPYNRLVIRAISGNATQGELDLNLYF